jgi:hypothetical protein
LLRFIFCSQVMIAAASKVGHVPRVVGVAGIEATTQPPGILTWAAALVYNLTLDKDFLLDAYARPVFAYPLVLCMPFVLTADLFAGSTSRHSETAPSWEQATAFQNYRLQI